MYGVSVPTPCSTAGDQTDTKEALGTLQAGKRVSTAEEERVAGYNNKVRDVRARPCRPAIAARLPAFAAPWPTPL